MRVKCANCGIIYDINPTSMDFRTEHEIFSTGTCPKCKSNAKDKVQHAQWTTNTEYLKK